MSDHEPTLTEEQREWWDNCFLQTARRRDYYGHPLDQEDRVMLAVAARLAWLEAERPRLIKGSLGFITTPTYQRILADKEADNAALRAEIERWQSLFTAPDLLEGLANLEHKRWSGWEEYRADHSGMGVMPSARVHKSGEGFEERWKRQRETDYSDLSEAEKESDRIEARRGLALIHEWLSATPPPTPASGNAQAGDGGIERGRIE